MSEPVPHAEHFENLGRQGHAARLGMWVFLSSEVMFFASLFALYGTYRVEHPAGFGEGVLHNTLALGSTTTGVLLLSSYTIALAVHQLRRGGSPMTAPRKDHEATRASRRAGSSSRGSP